MGARRWNSKNLFERQFDELFRVYNKYRREGRGIKNSHQKKSIVGPPKKAVRKSKRLGSQVDDYLEVLPEENAIPIHPDQSPPVKKQRATKRIITDNPNKIVWMEDYGSKLFDVLSHHCLRNIENCKKNEVPETFDSEYYFDQVNPSQRKQFIHIGKVTQEYIDEQQTKQQKLARKASRMLSAKGSAEYRDTESVLHDEDDNSIDDEKVVDEDCHVGLSYSTI